MGNEVVYQITGFAVVFLGGIWGLKLRKNQVQKEKDLTEPSEKIKIVETIQNNQHNLERELMQSKEIQYSLREENVFLKGKIHHFEKQIISFQNTLNTINSQKDHFEYQAVQNQSTVRILQDQFQKLELSQEEIKSDHQKKTQELLTENQSLSLNLRREVAKRADLQQQVYILDQIQKKFLEKEQQQQQAIQELEQKNKELNQSKIEINTSLHQQVEHLREEKYQLEQVLKQQISNAKILQAEITQLITESRGSKLSYQQAIAEINALKKHVHLLEVDKIRLQGEFESQTEQLIQKNSVQEQMIIKVNELKQQISLLEVDKGNLQQALDSNKNAIAQSNQNNNPLKQELDTSEKENEQDHVKNLELISQSDKLITQNKQQLIHTTQQIIDNKQQIVDTTQDITEFTKAAEIQTMESELIIEEIETQKISPPEKDSHNPPTNTSLFTDKKFIILGTLTQISREQAKKLIEEAGGSVISSANSKTNYVLVGKSPGEKLKKAQKLGISQLSETQFLSLLKKNH